MKYINPMNCRQNLFSGSSLRDIEKELNLLLGQLPTWGTPKAAESRTQRAIRNLEWFESNEAFVARFDLPGVKSSDVTLEIDSGVISLKATRSDSKPEESKDEPRSTYQANLKVPENVREEDITADLENGVISISFPKEEKAKARRIEIREAN